MFKHAMDRMNRDFAGMIRFRTFAVEGKLSMPAIASESIPVTRDGQTMAVDETLLRITTLPTFDGTSSHWKGVVTASANSDPVLPVRQDAAPVTSPIAAGAPAAASSAPTTTSVQTTALKP